MKLSFSLLNTTISLMFLTLGACGGSQGFGTETTSSSSISAQNTDVESYYTTTKFEGGAVSDITFEDDTNEEVIDFADVTKDEKYIVALYSYSDDETTHAFEIKAPDVKTLPLANQEKALTLDIMEESTENFHDQLRVLENELPQQSEEVIGTMKAATKKYNPSVGSARTFKVISSLSKKSYTSADAVLKYKTDHFLFWVDSRDDAEGVLSDAEIATICENFEEQIPNITTLFGEPADIDGDGRFNIFMSRLVNAMSNSSGGSGIITGFFYGNDQILGDNASSNETDILYALRPDASGTYGSTISKSFTLSNVLPSVLRHEFQHMINFNQHHFLNKGDTEISSLNEGLSHLAEDTISVDDDLYMTKASIENPSRVARYLENPQDICITCGSSLKQRGAMYLLLRYLYEQSERGTFYNPAQIKITGYAGPQSGAEFINRIMSSPLTGVDNIAHAVFGDVNDSGEMFAKLLGQFSLAVLLSDTSLSDNNQYQFFGINLRSDNQEDHRGTDVQGPAVMLFEGNESFTATIGGASIGFIEMTGTQIEALGGSINIQLPEGAHGGVYIVQTAE